MRFNYSVRDGEAVITGPAEYGTVITIPETIDNYPVTSIERKAFLGIKGLRSVEIPASVQKIGDWAFAQCIHLREVTIKGTGEERLGRGVFEGDTRLERIALGEGVSEDCSVILATVIQRLAAEYLLRDSETGSENWYMKWDLALSAFLSQDDLEGYSDKALCGEEDISYDGIGSVDGELLGENYSYIVEKNKNKCYLCLVRLMHPEHLSEKNRKTFADYLKNHEKGIGNESAWLTVKDDFKDNLDTLKLFIEVTNPSPETITAMIEDAGNLAEIKAYLINLNTKNKTDSFFDDLEL